jgi:hypothetical protein
MSTQNVHKLVEGCVVIHIFEIILNLTHSFGEDQYESALEECTHIFAVYCV